MMRIPFLLFCTGMSVIAFFAYGIDKRRAKKNQWRTPEAVLLSLGIFGGALGAVFAMKLLRHKTRHWYFWAINVLALAMQIAIGVMCR